MEINTEVLQRVQTLLNNQMAEFAVKSESISFLAERFAKVLDTVIAEHPELENTVFGSVYAGVISSGGSYYTYAHIDLNLRNQINWTLTGEIIAALDSAGLLSVEQWASLDVPAANCRVYTYPSTSGTKLVEITCWLGDNAECKRVIVGTRKGYVHPELIEVDEPDYKFSCPQGDA